MLAFRPGNNSWLSGILGLSYEIFCESAVIATSEITRFSVKISIFNNLTENFNTFTEHFLSLRLIDFAFLCIFDAVSKVLITALSQKIFESNLGISESPELFPGLVLISNMCLDLHQD